MSDEGGHAAVLVDPRILVHEPEMGIRLGAESISSRQFQASAATTSQHTYTLNTPSLNTIVDRAMFWESTVVLQITYNTGSAASWSPQYGIDWGIASYPLNRLTTSQSLSINDVSTQLSTATVLPQLFRLHDSSAARAGAGGCTTMNDVLVDSRVNRGNPVYQGSLYYSDGNLPNGTFANWEYCNGDGTSFTAGQTSYAVGGGSAALNANLVPVTAASSPAATQVAFIKITTREPLFVSPLSHGDSYSSGQDGMWGIQNMTFTAQMQSPESARIIRDLSGTFLGAGAVVYSPVAAGVANGVFQSNAIRATFITPPINYPLPQKSITPYVSYQNYQYTDGTSINANATKRIPTPSITLQNTPDMVLIWVTAKSSERDAWGSAAGGPGVYGTGDFTLPIHSCSVSYTNQQGLLSGMTQYQLWKISKENGYDMSFPQWRGLFGFGASAGTIGAGTLARSNILASGGALLLKFGKDITLTAGDAPGVAGANAFSVDLEIGHYFDGKNGYTASSMTPVINIMTISSGYLASSAGKSTLTITPLTEAKVLKAIEGAVDHSVSSRAMENSLEGGFLGHLTSAWGKARQLFDQGKSLYEKTKPYVTKAKEYAESSGYEPAQKLARYASQVGYGVNTGSGSETGSGRPFMAQRYMHH
jgi:hypothetical protein